MQKGYWAIQQAIKGRVGGHAAHVLLIMALDANQDDAYTGTVGELAAKTGLSSEEVVEASRELLDADLISLGDGYTDPTGEGGVLLVISRCRESGRIVDLPWVECD